MIVYPQDKIKGQQGKNKNEEDSSKKHRVLKIRDSKVAVKC